MKKFLFLFFVLTATFLFANEDSFVDSNLKDFYTFTLENDIPVIVKKSKSDMVGLRLIIEGGNSQEEASHSGFEAITLKLMCMSSKNYSNDRIHQMEYEESTGLETRSSADYSNIGFTCSKASFKNTYAMFEDVFFNPLFESKLYKRTIDEYSARIVANAKDPYYILIGEAFRQIYDSHPYISRKGPDFESIKNVTPELLKETYEKFFDSKRLKFVVSGNFSKKELKNLEKKLNKNFGKIEAGDYKKVELPPSCVKPGLIYKNTETAGESAYVFACYDVPDCYEKDYLAYLLALSIMNDKYFSVIREQSGAVYSVSGSAFGGRCNVGFIYFYKMVKGKNITELVKKANDEFPFGQNLESVLGDYKNKLINELYSTMLGTSGILSQITSGIELYGDEATYLKRLEQIRNVSAGDVELAFKKYIAPMEYLWIVVCAPGAEGDFIF